MKMVYFNRDGLYHPLITILVTANQAREICINMKQVFPDWNFAFSNSNEDGWDFKI